jgi:hypothetical protein
VEIVSQRVLAEEMLGQQRTVVVGDSFEDGTVTNGIDLTFVRQGTHLRAAGPGTTVPEALTAAFDSSGDPLRLRPPEGYERAASFTTFQWLDDDRVALMAGAGTMGSVPGLEPDVPEVDTGYGDIIVCRTSSGLCRVAVTGPRQFGDLDGDEVIDKLRIVPHYGTPGTN